MSATPRNRLIWIALVVGAVIAIPRLGEALPSGDDRPPAAAAPTAVATDRAAQQSGATPTDPTTSDTPPATGPTPTATGSIPTAPQAAPSPAAKRTPAARPGTALATALTLTVKGRAPKTGYDRAQFGQAWLDTDRNGCDTRNDILRRDLRSLVLKAGTRGCLVLRGTLNDPYTARTISFVRGQTTSTAAQIDHVVALADAWQKGAQQWSGDRRAAFANDPLNLLAVDGPTNQAKGAGDTATWLPPNKSYRCTYVARQVAVKAKYHLWVTAAERDAMVRVLTPCPTQPLPTAGPVKLGGGREEAVGSTSPQPAPKPSPRATAPAPVVGGQTDPRFATCKAAKAAGYGPYRSGVDVEYGWYRDGDRDGTVCE
ncbi:hypothetical protein N864_15890 [Intrasporangium chromatireducens Q5-1]|uniref:Excalibur calcium-binding domain-containing protein n=1 Tax=Intrasporangium chromatireducens Q5-1 TaxID=584657 RepID=W9GFE2_9MICO|nr:DUF1524 domain-containing protein [Intrasporangium chromatireducens]EWT04936.1 hypothetical protein N864_15890 [Intrasporangium chromatireducens Q5-1]